MERKLYIEKSFASLNELKILGNQPSIYIPNEQNSLCGEINTIRAWEHYGQYNDDRIILSLNGKTENIKFEKFEFSNIVRDELFFYSSRRGGERHKFVLEGRDEDGRIFEGTFVTRTDDILPYIVYAMILITEIKDINKTQYYWKCLTDFKNEEQRLTLPEQLDLLYKTRELSLKIIRSYPFMEKFLQEGNSKIIEVIQKNLNSFDILAYKI